MDAYTEDSILNPPAKGKQKKVLVCVTPQSNCRRLIDSGHEISLETEGEMHILHILHGNNVFSEGVGLLEELFDYGSKLGGTTHGICGSDIPKTLISFIKKHKITHIVLGYPGEDSTFKDDTLTKKLLDMFPDLNINMV